MRRRIWCELLSPEELAGDATIALLQKYALEPIVALPPAKETDAMYAALAKLTNRGIHVGLWPLLRDDQGYWPSLHNADAFADRVFELLPRLAREHIAVKTMAFDLEPPLEVTRSFMNGGAVEKLKAMATSFVDRAPAGESPGGEVIARLETVLRTRGIETLAAVMPMLILDLASGATFWERVLRTPRSVASWSKVSPMLYTTIIAENLPSESLESARIILHQGARILVDALGAEHASASLGLVTTGKLGTEPFYPSPDELRLDVEAARAAGVDDLALFSLEGVLSRGAPETWLDPFTRAEARAPAGPRARVVSSLVRGAAWASTPLGWIR